MKKIMNIIKNKNVQKATFGVTLGVMLGLLATNTSVYAASASLDSLSSWFQSAVQEVYAVILKLTPAVAVAVIAFALLVRMFVKDERRIQTYNAWIRTAIISWICIMLLGLLADVITEFTAGGQWSA